MRCGHKVKLTRCPRYDVTPAAWHMLEMYEFARGGAWPIAGGVLDQTDSFLSAYRLLRELIPQ